MITKIRFGFTELQFLEGVTYLRRILFLQAVSGLVESTQEKSKDMNGYWRMVFYSDD